jgi:hypothetical protein
LADAHPEQNPSFPARLLQERHTVRGRGRIAIYAIPFPQMAFHFFDWMPEINFPYSDDSEYSESLSENFGLNHQKLNGKMGGRDGIIVRCPV